MRRLVTEGGAEGPLAAALGRLVHHEERLAPQRRELMGEMAALVVELCLTRATEMEDPAAHAFDARVGETLRALGGGQYVVSRRVGGLAGGWETGLREKRPTTVSRFMPHHTHRRAS